MAIEKCIRCEVDGISLTVCIVPDGLAIEGNDEVGAFGVIVTDMEFAYQLADLINSVRPVPVQQNMEHACVNTNKVTCHCAPGQCEWADNIREA